MSTSRDRVRQALSHQGSDRIPVDFGATAVTGIHCRVVEALRKHYGLSYKPGKNGGNNCTSRCWVRWTGIWPMQWEWIVLE